MPESSPTVVPSARTGIRPVAATAIAWSLAFAAIHLAWAMGSTVGLDGRRVTGVLLVIDIVAIPLCLLAAWIAWRLRDSVRAAEAPPVVRRLAWAAAAVAHTTLIRLVLCHLLGIPAEYRRVFPMVSNVALTEIELRHGACAALLRYNVPLDGAGIPVPPAVEPGAP